MLRGFVESSKESYFGLNARSLLFEVTCSIVNQHLRKLKESNRKIRDFKH